MHLDVAAEHGLVIFIADGNVWDLRVRATTSSTRTPPEFQNTGEGRDEPARAHLLRVPRTPLFVMAARRSTGPRTT